MWVGALLQILALVSLFGFATYVGTALLPERGRADWLRGLATGAGQAFVVLVLAGFAIGSLARFRAGPGLDISAALALFDIHVALYIASWVLGSVFMAAAAALGLRSRALPVWLCIAAALAAVINLAAVVLPATPIATFPNLLIWLWTVSASVAFVLRERRLRSPVTRPAAVANVDETFVVLRVHDEDAGWGNHDVIDVPPRPRDVAIVQDSQPIYTLERPCQLLFASSSALPCPNVPRFIGKRQQHASEEVADVVFDPNFSRSLAPLVLAEC